MAAIAVTCAGVTVCEHVSWQRSHEGARAVVTIVGDLDFACAGAFAAALAAVAADGTDVVLDMRGVAFIDTAAVDAFDRARRLFELMGLRVTVRAPSRPVRRLLGLCRLDGLIESAEGSAVPMFVPNRPDGRVGRKRRSA